MSGQSITNMANKIRELEQRRALAIRHIQTAEQYRKRVIEVYRALSKQLMKKTISLDEFKKKLAAILDHKTPADWLRYYEGLIQAYEREVVSITQEIKKIKETPSSIRGPVLLFIALLLLFVLFSINRMRIESPVIKINHEQLTPKTNFFTNALQSFVIKTTAPFIPKQTGTINEPPVANAGPDQTLYAGSEVILDASQSSDPNNDPLTYTWTRGNQVFEGKIVKKTVNKPGTYTIKLTVSDGKVSAEDTVSITVLPNENQGKTCTNNWQCTDWSACNDKGIQTRACQDLNNCPLQIKKPAEQQNCLGQTAANNKPTQLPPILNSTYGYFQVNEDLICYPQGTFDADGDIVTNVFNYFQNDQKTMALNMPFEGNVLGIVVRDYSRNENNGTAIGGVTFLKNGGFIGSAYNFDGTNDRIDIPNAATLNPTNNVTFEMWINFPIGGSSATRAMLAKRSQFQIQRLTTNQVSLRIANQFGIFTTATSNTVLSAATPYHLIFLVNTTDPVPANNKIKIYINGVLDATTTFSAQSIRTGVDRVTIGAVQNAVGGFGSFYAGIIDEVRIYPSLLSDEEIKSHTNKRYNNISSSLLKVGNKWRCEVTPNDATEDGSTLESDNVTINQTTFLNSCGTLILPNTNYTLFADLGSPAGCLVIQANNISVNCGNHLINYSNSTLGAITGIGISSTYNLTTINNCQLQQGRPFAGPTASSHGILYQSSEFSKIINTNILTLGLNAIPVDIFSSRNLTIEQNIFNASGEGTGALLLQGMMNGTVMNNLLYTGTINTPALRVLSSSQIDVHHNTFISEKDFASRFTLVNNTFFFYNYYISDTGGIEFDSALGPNVYNNFTNETIFNETTILDSLDFIDIQSLNNQNINNFINLISNRNLRIPVTSDTNNMTFFWFIKVLVLNDLNLPINGAQINITDVNNQLLFDGVTSSLGLIPLTEFKERTLLGSGNVIDFNNYTISVSFPTFVQNITSLNLTNTSFVSISLSKVNTPPIINTVFISPLTPFTEDTLDCAFNVADAESTQLFYNVTWFKNGIPQIDNQEFGTIDQANFNTDVHTSAVGDVEPQYTTQQEQWICKLTIFETPGSGFIMAMNATPVVIQNRIPPNVTLLNLNNDSFISINTPSFNWTNVSDLDLDVLSYIFEIANDTDFNALAFKDIIPDPNTTIPQSSPLLDGMYFWHVITNDSFNTAGSDTFTFQINTSKSISISLSPTLANGVNWTILSLPVENLSAEGNNDLEVTEYNIAISATRTTVDIYMKADDDLKTSSGDILGLSNETYSVSIVDPTVPSDIKTSITENFIDNKIGSDLGDQSIIYLKFFVNAPASQPAGEYSNNVFIAAVPNGSPPPS